MEIIKAANGTMGLKLSIDELKKVAADHGFSLVKNEASTSQQTNLNKQFANLEWTLSKRANQAEQLDGTSEDWYCDVCGLRSPSDDFLSYGMCPGCGCPLSGIKK